MYSYVNAGLIAARGIISAGTSITSASAPCTGILYFRNNPNNPPRKCFWRIYAPDVNQILSDPLLPRIALNLPHPLPRGMSGDPGQGAPAGCRAR